MNLYSHRDACGLRHWANGAEKLPRARFSENSAPVMDKGKDQGCVIFLFDFPENVFELKVGYL